MERIVVIGCGGAGKSTLARQMATVLGVKVVHLDALYWKPGWVATSKGEWSEIVKALLAEEKWVIDGNFGGTRRLRFEAADTIIFLDFPRALCLCRVIWRRWQYRGKTRPDMGQGCSEKLDWEFLKWIWDFPTNSRPKIMSEIEAYGHDRKVIVLRRPREVKQFLKQTRYRVSK
jgi:adenylate kinase family enzyme